MLTSPINNQSTSFHDSITMHSDIYALPDASSVFPDTSPLHQHGSPHQSHPRAQSHNATSLPPLLSLQPYPRSSILLNPHKRSLKGLVCASTSLEARNQDNQFPPPPVITHIPAVSPHKALKEKEREREKGKGKPDEKIWGIPKRALLLGLSDLNFNAQMAMLGGWGHGSGGSSNMSTSNSATNSEKMLRSPSSQSAKLDDEQSDHASSASDSELEQTMTPEELAALNAIINTRRSMAAAQALVNGEVCFHTRPSSRLASASATPSSESGRPTLNDSRAESQDSVPSMATFSQSDSSNGTLPLSPSEMFETLPVMIPNSHVSPPLQGLCFSGTVIGTSPTKQARIRFAPLPQPFGTPPKELSSFDAESKPDDPLKSDDVSDATISQSRASSDDKSHHDAFVLNRLKLHNSSHSDASDGDSESESDYEKSQKGKWYLMGMHSSMFKYSTSSSKTSRKRALSKGGSTGGSGLDDEDAPAVTRRKSTGSLAETLASEFYKKGWNLDAWTGHLSDKDDEDRGRDVRRSSRTKASSSGSRKGRRSNSRSGARSSGEEDERARRRELIRLARPGGTGMVTLPDGTKIRARRVNDPDVVKHDSEVNEWGFAGLAREASRRGQYSAPGSTVGTNDEGESRLGGDEEDDEEDDDLGLAWIRRRRREREARKQREEEAERAKAEQARVEAEEQTIAHESPVATTAADDPEKATLSETSNVTGPDTTSSVIVDEPESITTPTMSSSAWASENPEISPKPASTVMSTSTSASAKTPTLPSAPSSQVVTAPPTKVEGRSNSTGARLALSADQAEEIRRRHEDEVAALGYEVLAANRRNTLRKSSTIRQASVNTVSSDQASTPKATRDNSISGSATNSASGSRILPSPSAMKQDSQDSQARATVSRAVGTILRKATIDSERPKSKEEKQKKMTNHQQVAITKESPTIPSSSSSVNNLHLVDSRDQASITSNTSSQAASRRSSHVNNRHSIYVQLQSSASSLHVSGANSQPGMLGTPSTRRISLDPGISVPTPSPWLPRRPDVRGMAVVPLPQLGIRPERPCEGRVWQYDVSDDSDSDETIPSKADHDHDHDHDEDDEDDDLDAEELLEEERKTAFQKKRATTRAAGQEIVHARSTDQRRRVDDELAASKKIGTSASHSNLRKDVGGASKHVRPTPSISSVRTWHGSTTRVNHDHHDTRSNGSDEDENMWPAVSATSKNGTPRPRHILVNLPGGLGIWDTKKGGGPNAVAAINTVAAARAKAVKKRAQKHQKSGRKSSLELSPDWDDEMMDYGWPRSLKGSLY